MKQQEWSFIDPGDPTCSGMKDGDHLSPPTVVLTLIPVTYLKKSTDAFLSHLPISDRSDTGMSVLDTGLSINH